MPPAKSFHLIALADDGTLGDSTPAVGLSASNGRWWVLTNPNARLHPSIDLILSYHASARPDVDVFYGDEAVLGRDLRSTDAQYCKPSFDRTQILAQDYIGWPIFIKGVALKRAGGATSEAGTAATYDLILRAVSAGLEVERIAEVLVAHPAPPTRASSHDHRAAVERYLHRSNAEIVIGDGRRPGTFRLSRVFETYPHVTLVVPTAQSRRAAGPSGSEGQPHILNLLASLSASTWPADKLSVLIGDDVTDDAIYRDGKWPFEVERVVTDRPVGEAFNYARKMNRLWRMVRGEYLVMMNDDLVIRSPDWLHALMTFATDETVGGVGARLLYPDGTLQHVGMPGGVMTVCTHAFVGMDGDAPTYQNWADVQREWSIVTGAVFATRKSLLEQINGYDEKFSLEYNDVDMCLRLRLLGYRIVYTPFAELTHYESATRGRRRPPADEVALFMERWSDYLKDDPAYNPRLVRDTPIIAPAPQPDDWWLGEPSGERDLDAPALGKLAGRIQYTFSKVRRAARKFGPLGQQTSR